MTSSVIREFERMRWSGDIADTEVGHAKQDEVGGAVAVGVDAGVAGGAGEGAGEDLSLVGAEVDELHEVAVGEVADDVAARTLGDDEDVVAGTADELVEARLAVEPVVLGAAEEGPDLPRRF